MNGRSVHVGQLDRVPLMVSRHPGATLFSLVFHVIRRSRHGVPASLRDLVRNAMPRSGAESLHTVFTRGSWAPDSLSLTRHLDASGSSAVLDELDALDPEVFMAELHRQHDNTPLPHWRAAAAQPRAFLSAYRNTLRSVWDALAPLWQEAAPYLQREQERVGLATVTNSLEALFGSLGSKVRYADGAFHLPQACPSHLTTLGQRPIVLVPLASGSLGTYSAERDDVLWLGYPLPGLAQLVSSTTPTTGADADRLAVLLGHARAGILRHAHRRPSLSDTARHVGISVSTASYHCDQLTHAGLLLRQRQGQQVRLHLTDKGHALMDLLS